MPGANVPTSRSRIQMLSTVSPNCGSGVIGRRSTGTWFLWLRSDQEPKRQG